MLLVYLSSRFDLNSVKSYLRVKGLTDHLLLYEVEDLVEELITEPSEVLVFDYKGDYELVERLRTINDLVLGLKVFVSNSSIGQIYVNLTEDIFVLPDALNLMIYIWESPVFSLGNILNAEDLGREVFSVDDFATIDTENEIIEFKTIVEDMGEMDLASIKLLKLAKCQLAESFRDRISNEEADLEEIPDDIYDLPSRTLDGLLRRNGYHIESQEFDLNEAGEDIEKENNKLLNILKNTIFVEKKQKEFTVPLLSFTGDDCRSENWITLEEQQAIEEFEAFEEQQTIEESVIEEVLKEEPFVDGSIPETDNDEGLFNVLDASESIEPITLLESKQESTFSIKDNTDEPEKQQVSIEKVDDSIDESEKQEVVAEKVDNNFLLSEERIEENIVYKEYNEDEADTYDEIMEYTKSITSDTTVNAEYEGDMRDDLKNNGDVTGVVNTSTGLLSGSEYVVNESDFRTIQESQKEIIDKLKESKKIPTPVQEISKSAPHVLEGVKSYVAPAKKVDRVVAIKTVEAETESTSKPKTGGLSGLRRRSVKTFKNPYEYFQHSLPLTPERKAQLAEVNDYVIRENYKGSSLLLENELYSRGFITDDEMVAFMKNYLHQNVMTLEELMKADVIVDELWSIEESLANGLLQISSKYTSGEGKDNAICIVCCTKAFPLLKSLSVQYERIIQFVTLEKFIKIRLGREE